METPYRQQGNHAYHGKANSNGSGSTNDDDIARSKFKPGGPRVFHDFYKTKMCNLFLLNICKNGEDCPFAHSETEIREKPNLHKTKLCQTFIEEGRCKKGKNCCFAHGEEELRSTPDLFKTAICNLWTQRKCTSGDKCRFAHGQTDLRPSPHFSKSRKPNFKKDFNPDQQIQKPQQNQQIYHQNFDQPQYQAPQSFPSFPEPSTFEYFMVPEMNVSDHFQDANIMGAFSNKNRAVFSNFDY